MVTTLLTIPVTCTESHVQTPLHRHYLTHANNHITPAMAAFLNKILRFHEAVWPATVEMYQKYEL